MTDEEKIDEFLNKLKDKIKINRRTGNAYLPLSVIYGIRRKKDNCLDFEGLPWILGAYTEGGLSIQDDMQNTILYDYMYWSNRNVSLDSHFDIEKYVEHIVKCPQCHQKYSDKFSNYTPSKNDKDSLCVLCLYRGFNKCNKDKDKCGYEYNDIECKDCFFNGGELDPRMSEEDNKSHLAELKNYRFLNRRL